MRGTANALSRGYAAARITPACAGNRSCGELQQVAAEDHPRVCGEQCCRWWVACTRKGSPPRVRGTVLRFALISDFYGITPACAGNRLIHDLSQFVSWDHPRVCGEQYISILVLIRDAGSPPRVRGTVEIVPAITQDSRITPACAGNSRQRCQCSG